MVFVPTDNIISSTMETVKQVSIKHKVPVFGGSTEMIAVGGFITTEPIMKNWDGRQLAC
ncbi:ABC transporter periplasmic [Streptococcus pneumoniae]|nr:ABC transporter periplasmic [Streptococcus pneumoniae]